MFNLRRYLVFFVPLWLMAFWSSAICKAAQSEGSTNDEREQIASLIESLGSPNYSTRREAEDALKSLGVKALDQLNIAKDNPNLQIAAMARYLLNSSNTIWFYEDDTPRIRKLLSEYAYKNPIERDSTLNILALLDGDEGVSALARIARYEYNGDLSKRAALKLMSLDDAYAVPDQLKNRWSSIREIVGDAGNTASTWLIHYANAYERSLSQNPATYRQDMTAITQDIVLPKPFEKYEYRLLPLGLTKFASFTVRMVPEENETQWWKDQIEKEFQLLDLPSEDTSITVVELLCRVASEYALRCGKKGEAMDLARQLFRLPDRFNDFPSVLGRVTWSIDYGMPGLATELMIKTNEAMAAKDSHLLRGEVADMQLSYYESSYWKYHLAEAYFWQGKVDEANAVAEQALKIPSYSDSYSYQIQFHLQNRMMYQWAVNEYLHAINSQEKGADIPKLYATIGYLRYLQNCHDYDKVVEISEKVIERLDSDPAYADRVKSELQVQNMDDFRASYLFAKGKLFKQRGEIDAAKTNFRDAYKLQEENVDALIELNQLQGDAVYQKEVNGLLDKELDALLKKSKQSEEDMRTVQPDRFATAKGELANTLNTYAWVLCNTNRDLDKALQTSIISNRLKKNSPEYTDTLARCYFVKGDLENAIYWQERSVSLDPSQRQLLLTLLEYQEAAKLKSDKK